MSNKKHYKKFFESKRGHGCMFTYEIKQMQKILELDKKKENQPTVLELNITFSS